MHISSGSHPAHSRTARSGGPHVSVPLHTVPRLGEAKSSCSLLKALGKGIQGLRSLTRVRCINDTNPQHVVQRIEGNNSLYYIYMQRKKVAKRCRDPRPQFYLNLTGRVEGQHALLPHPAMHQKNFTLKARAAVHPPAKALCLGTSSVDKAKRKQSFATTHLMFKEMCCCKDKYTHLCI